MIITIAAIPSLGGKRYDIYFAHWTSSRFKTVNVYSHKTTAKTAYPEKLVSLLHFMQQTSITRQVAYTLSTNIAFIRRIHTLVVLVDSEKKRNQNEFASKKEKHIKARRIAIFLFFSRENSFNSPLPFTVNKYNHSLKQFLQRYRTLLFFEQVIVNYLHKQSP